MIFRTVFAWLAIRLGCSDRIEGVSEGTGANDGSDDMVEPEEEDEIDPISEMTVEQARRKLYQLIDSGTLETVEANHPSVPDWLAESQVEILSKFSSIGYGYGPVEFETLKPFRQYPDYYFLCYNRDACVNLAKPGEETIYFCYPEIAVFFSWGKKWLEPFPRYESIYHMVLHDLWLDEELLANEE